MPYARRYASTGIACHGWYAPRGGTVVAMSPLYVALEGPEASGKTTVAARLAQHLGAVLTRETGGTPIGARIRGILHDVDVVDLADRAEALLTAADRAQHLAQVVLPALQVGRHVVSDRSVYSTLAYQGYGRQLDVEELRHINDWAIGGRWPDFVVLVDVDEHVRRERIRERDLDRFEREDAAFHHRVHEGFHLLAAAEAQRWAIVDGSRPLDTVVAEVVELVEQRLAQVVP